MKVTLDLGSLLADGSITREDHDRLLALSARGTASLAFSILVGFAVVSVALGTIALVPNAVTGIVIGGAMLGAGLLSYQQWPGRWDILAHIFVLIGALVLGGGLIVLADASIPAMLGIAAGFTLAGIAARSGLLVMLAVLALSSAIGARTGYTHASYFLGIKEPAMTIALFALVALGTFLASLRLPHAYARLAIIAARTSVFLVNFGFWIGSLWGDTVHLGFAAEGSGAASFDISDKAFAIGWAGALVATGIWATMADRRWVVSTVTVFGIIHFYSQWFEWFGPNPLAILLAGIVTLAVALGLWRYNRALWPGANTGTGVPKASAD